MERLIDAWNCLDPMWQGIVLGPLVIIPGVALGIGLIVIHEKLVSVTVYRLTTGVIFAPFVFLDRHIERLEDWLQWKFPQTLKAFGWIFCWTIVIAFAAVIILFFVAIYQSVVCYIKV